MIGKLKGVINSYGAELRHPRNVRNGVGYLVHC